jgi:hypothetical protein
LKARTVWRAFFSLLLQRKRLRIVLKIRRSWTKLWRKRALATRKN